MNKVDGRKTSKKWNIFVELKLMSFEMQTHDAKYYLLWLIVFRRDMILCTREPTEKPEQVFPRYALLPYGKT